MSGAAAKQAKSTRVLDRRRPWVDPTCEKAKGDAADAVQPWHVAVLQAMEQAEKVRLASEQDEDQEDLADCASVPPMR